MTARARSASSLAIVAAAAILAVVALAISGDAVQGWVLLGAILFLGVLILVGDLNAAAHQALMAAVVAVLLPVLTGGGDGVTSLIKWFGVYPHAYAAAATTALLCFALRTTSAINTLRPATSVALVTSGSLLGLADRAEQLLFLIAFAAVPLLAQSTRFAKLRPPVQLLYAVIEPLLMVAVVWGLVPSLRTATFRLTLLEFT